MLKKPFNDKISKQGGIVGKQRNEQKINIKFLYY